MAFEVYTITNIGATFLAQATSVNKLVISGCGVEDTEYTTEEAQELEAFTGDLYTEKAELIGVDGSHIVYRASFPASNVYGGNHKSLLLYGHLQSDTSGINYIIAVASTSEPFHIPTQADTISIFECLFTLQFSAVPNAYTTQTTALEASKAEFDVLESRTLTTNTKWNTTSGEAQDVYGLKTFKTGIVVEGNFDAETITANDINPHSGNEITLGTAITTVVVPGWINLQDISCNSINVANDSLEVGSVSAIFKVDVEMWLGATISAPFLPDGSSASIGSSTNPFPNVYASSASIENASITNVNSAVKFNGNINLVGTIYPVASGTSSIGTSGARINNVYASNANISDLTAESALLPSANSTNFPKGCIAFIQIPSNSLKFGDSYTNTSTSHKVVAFDGTAGTRSVPANSVWVLLSEPATLNSNPCALCRKVN